MAADAAHGIAASDVFGGIPRIPALDFPDCATRRCDPGRMPASRGGDGKHSGTAETKNNGIGRTNWPAE